jgi:hypothetical protein
LVPITAADSQESTSCIYKKKVTKMSMRWRRQKLEWFCRVRLDHIMITKSDDFHFISTPHPQATIGRTIHPNNSSFKANPFNTASVTHESWSFYGNRRK